jgi:hypothetical protein
MTCGIMATSISGCDVCTACLVVFAIPTTLPGPHTDHSLYKQFILLIYFVYTTFSFQHQKSQPTSDVLTI